MTEAIQIEKITTTIILTPYVHHFTGLRRVEHT